MKKLILISVLFGFKAMAAQLGVAGCGLGSLIVKDTTPQIQIAASILNGTGVQSSGITTGTSNCGPGVFAELRYIEDNKQVLQAEVAQGNGETLAGLLTMWGCEASGATALKANYSQIFNSENSSASALSGAMKSALKTNSCQNI